MRRWSHSPAAAGAEVGGGAGPAPGAVLRYSDVDPSGVLVDWLSARRPEELSADEALEAAAGWERVIAHAQAQQLSALNRFARLRPDGDGLPCEFAADEATAAYARLDAPARSGPADGRSIDARRADALVDLVCGRDDGAQAPPVTTTVGITMTAATLAGLADDPGYLDGDGPIPAAMARDLAAAARRWRGLITDEHTGDLTDVTRAYRPRQLLAEFPFCRHHHRLKHETDWKVTQPEARRVPVHKPHRAHLPVPRTSTDRTRSPPGRPPIPATLLGTGQGLPGRPTAVVHCCTHEKARHRDRVPDF